MKNTSGTKRGDRTDSGDWLSAEQAVMPDGSQRGHLPLVHRKLPALGQVGAVKEANAKDASEKKDAGTHDAPA